MTTKEAYARGYQKQKACTKQAYVDGYMSKRAEEVDRMHMSLTRSLGHTGVLDWVSKQFKHIDKLTADAKAAWNDPEALNKLLNQ